MNPSALAQQFQSTYGSKPTICRAPGRVNLIGEHTDYNDGFVLPVAIDRYTWTALAWSNNRELRVHSSEAPDEPDYDASSLSPRGKWSDYVAGVIAELFASGLPVCGADVLVHGEVPIGAGLSSSAALEVSTAFSALRSAGREIDRKAVALLCQRAENQFVGAKCGIMDQFISCHGRAGHALLLDCRSLDSRAVPLPTKARIVICNTMVKHDLATGEYNQRRQQCEQAVATLATQLPGIRALRDVTCADFNRLSDQLRSPIKERARHVISENERVLRAAQALENSELHRFGELMSQSHASLRDDYQVSSPELDLMVDLAHSLPGVYGSRMTGGGFGGCTVNLVDEQHAQAFSESIAARYFEKTAIPPEVYTCSAADGASEVA